MYSNQWTRKPIFLHSKKIVKLDNGRKNPHVLNYIVSGLLMRMSIHHFFRLKGIGKRLSHRMYKLLPNSNGVMLPECTVAFELFFLRIDPCCADWSS